jgi:hypothetical protein
MTRYLISFDAHAMDHIAGEDMHNADPDQAPSPTTRATDKMSDPVNIGAGQR